MLREHRPLLGNYTLILTLVEINIFLWHDLLFHCIFGHPIFQRSDREPPYKYTVQELRPD